MGEKCEAYKIEDTREEKNTFYLHCLVERGLNPKCPLPKSLPPQMQDIRLVLIWFMYIPGLTENNANHKSLLLLLLRSVPFISMACRLFLKLTMAKFNVK